MEITLSFVCLLQGLYSKDSIGGKHATNDNNMYSEFRSTTRWRVMASTELLQSHFGRVQIALMKTGRVRLKCYEEEELGYFGP